MFKNLLLSIISIILFFIIGFPLLNVTLGGVPLFYIFKLTDQEVIHISRTNINEFDTDEVRSNIDWYKLDFFDECGQYENGFTNLVYNKDQHGFRSHDQNVNNYVDTNIIILGDSFGASSCVNSPNDLTSQLVKKLDNKKILNLSKGGTGPYYQSEMFKALLKETNTEFKTLIWLFYEGNDAEDFNKSFNKKLKFDFSKEVTLNKKTADEIRNKYFVDYKTNKNIYFLKFKLFLANYFRGFGTLTKYIKKYPKLINNEDDYEKMFRNFNTFLNTKNIDNKIIYYIPKYTRLVYNDIPHPQLTQLNNLKSFIKNTATKYDFKFIDGVDFFKKKKDRLSIFHYNLPTHFNKKGYSLLADHLKNELSKLKKEN